MIYSLNQRSLLMGNNFNTLLVCLNKLVKVGCLKSLSLKSYLYIFHHIILALKFDSRVFELFRELSHQSFKLINGLIWILGSSISHEDEINCFLINGFFGNIVCSIENICKFSSTVPICNF